MCASLCVHIHKYTKQPPTYQTGYIQSHTHLKTHFQVLKQEHQEMPYYFRLNPIQFDCSGRMTASQFHVFPHQGQAVGSISLTPKIQLWTDTIGQIFLSDVCSHSAVFCLPFGRWGLRGSPGLSLLPSPEFKRSTAPNMTDFFTANFQIPGDILRELGRVWWVKFHIKRKVPRTTYGEEKKIITKLQTIPWYLLY